MKGFDLYRIAMGYLGVIFLLCAVVVFKPFSAIRPAAEAVALVPPVAELVAMPAPPAPASDPQTWVAVTTGPTVPVPPGVVAQVAADAGPAAHGPTAQVAGVDDTAEQVARLVAEAQSAQSGEEIGEGDASATADFLLTPEAEMVARGSDVTYTVGPGDSLGSLALRFYGDSALYSVIFEANRGLMGAPDRLRVGQVLIIPGRS